MWMVGVLSVGVIVNVLPLCSGAVTSFPDTQIKSFTKNFRKAILTKVVADFKQLAEDGKKLKTDAEICVVKVNRSVEACIRCSEQKCDDQSSPSVKQIVKHYLGYVNPIRYVEDPASSVAKGAKGAISVLQDESMPYINGVKNIAENINFAGIGKTLLSGLTTALDQLKNIFSGGFLDKLKFKFRLPFTRRKRSALKIDPKLRACMEKCSECTPYLADKKTMLESVCGKPFVNANETFYRKLAKTSAIQKTVVDEKTPVLQNLQYESNSFAFAPSMRYGIIYVKALIDGKYETYKSAHPFLMFDEETTAKNLANEYLARWK